jgi:glycosyltransferase involved in cell wall biosynthesis
MRILVIGHACSPVRGSEPGITWNHCWYLAQAGHEVWLITHPHYRDEVERSLAENPNPRLHIVWLELPRKLDPWDPKKGERGLKLHYILWQRRAAREARRLCASEKIDIAHHVSWGTIHAPPLLHRLPVPVVWGSLGGGEVIPESFSQYASSWMKEKLRRAQIAMLPLRPGFRRMAKAAALSLASNVETQRVLRQGGSCNAQLLIDCGLRDGYAEGASPDRPYNGELKLLWAGRLETRKALPLALEALAQTRARATLTIAGVGELREQYEQLSRELGIEAKVRFLGSVPWETMSRLFSESHAFVFTSLRDRFGTVVLEAMAHALPIVTLNHQGVGCFVPADASIKVAVTEPKQVIAELARAFELLESDAQQRLSMGQAALDYARTQSWAERTRKMVQSYDEILAARK